MSIAGSITGLRSAGGRVVSAEQLQRVIGPVRRHTSDLIASITGAVASVPDGMASSVIIGVPPIHGLYAAIVGPIVGGLTARTSLLIISTTSASALAAGEVINATDQQSRIDALLLVTLLAGAFQVIACLGGLARLAAFVSHSVMTGFLMGVATLIILGQLGTLVGFEPVGENAIVRTVDLARHIDQADPATAGIGLLTLFLLMLTRVTRLRVLGPVVALVVPSLIVSFAGLTTVATVAEIGSIPSGIPTPSIPELSVLNLQLVTGALGLAAIVFVQTAGVSQSLPETHYPDRQKRDLIAGGLANVGTALFNGQPVGGSLGQSALNRSAGAKTRWAAVMLGLWALVLILAFGNLIESVVMPALAALLIVAGLGAINFAEGTSVWQAGWGPRATILLTFVATLLLPIQVAVGLGVLFSALLYLSSAAADVHVVELVRLPAGGIKEQKPPATLPSETVTILQVDGSLFYAGARTLARKLPRAAEARRPVVVLRMRGKTRAGATLVDVLSNYERSLRDHGGRLYLAGVTAQMKAQLEASGKLHLSGAQIEAASPVRRKALEASYGAATRWLVSSQGGPEG